VLQNPTNSSSQRFVQTQINNGLAATVTLRLTVTDIAGNASTHDVVTNISP